MLFITTRQNQHILGVIPFVKLQNDTYTTFFQAQGRKTTQLNQTYISGLAFHSIFHYFWLFSC